MSKMFTSTIKKKANDQKHLLFYGHVSHMSTKFILDCIENNIILFLLPLHSSHIVQSLDNDTFGSLKNILFSHLNRIL